MTKSKSTKKAPAKSTKKAPAKKAVITSPLLEKTKKAADRIAKKAAKAKPEVEAEAITPASPTGGATEPFMPDDTTLAAPCDLAACGLDTGAAEAILALADETAEAKQKPAKARPKLTDAAWEAAKAGKLPPTPKFPASNASYIKRAEKLRKLAEDGELDALSGSEITGINTYAKTLRAYRDALICYLGTNEAAA